MLRSLFKGILGDPNEREIKRLSPLVQEINDLEPEMQARTNAELRELTNQFRQRIAQVSRDIGLELVDLREERDREEDADERRYLQGQIDRLTAERDRAEAGVLDEILPPAFAAVREAAVRTLEMRHYDVQLIGGLVLHQNKIAEMKTGEGKTLVATLPLYLNALTGRGVHLITPNDYLSKVGVQWMGPVYHLLGLSVAVIQSMGQDPTMSSFLFDPEYVAADDRYQHLRPCSRREAYQADVTYGTNNEFGFDHLRDNMVMDLGDCVQRELYYAIVDEVDNILIDEARTPLIISGEAEESAAQYRQFARIAERLHPEADYVIDEKERNVTATDEGISNVERMLGIENLYDPEHFQLTPYLENALKAKALFARDRDYVVTDGNVIIVDPFTGRMMYGRRYSEGLHQAIEAKENVTVQRESLTLATITFQNFFRMYRRLAGMTGTAETESEEFGQIYDLDVVVIPTHRPMIRGDHPDVVYKTEEAKFRAVLDEVHEMHEADRPVLLGTLAIETSEMLSERLRRMRIPHQVLNAKYHEREAQIIAQAGRPGAVTIATNMAGRGVDILLGGNPEGLARETLRREGQDLTELAPEVWEQALEEAEAQCRADRATVLQAGGLHVLGTERYEARRIDNQLRGRAGRQGDPGSSRFFVSLSDELMRRFGGETVSNLMDRLGVDEDTPIEHGMVSRALANAQIRVEGHNFDMRKHLLEYDDVVNQQRHVIYDQRRLVLSEANLKPVIQDILDQQIAGIVESYTQGYPEDWDLEALHAALDRMIHLPEDHTPDDWASLSAAEIEDEATELCRESYIALEESMGAEATRAMERLIMLRVIDYRWVRHLTALDELRQGIGLRAFAQRNPLVEYKREAFAAFETLLSEVQNDIANLMLNSRLEVRAAPGGSARVTGAPAPTAPRRHSGATGGATEATGAHPTQVRSRAKVGRNDPCPCGSGKKYKQCCLQEGLTPEQAAAKARTAG